MPGKKKCQSCFKYKVSSNLKNGRNGTIWEGQKICVGCDTKNNNAPLRFNTPQVPDMDVDEPDLDMSFDSMDEVTEMV